MTCLYSKEPGLRHLRRTGRLETTEDDDDNSLRGVRCDLCTLRHTTRPVDLPAKDPLDP
jgi:hypothetical protein